jgi:uncharacterized protein
MSGHDDDPGLPIPFGPCSNGEYDPLPLSPGLREVIRRSNLACDENARRLGMSRRDFLRTASAAATTLLTLAACSRDARRAAPPSSSIASSTTASSAPSTTSAPYGTGGTYALPPSTAVDITEAEAALGGEEFVFDVQGHLLEYDLLNPSSGTRSDGLGHDFWNRFPQQACGEADARACYSIERFLEAMFLQSDNDMVVVSALPLEPEHSPASDAVLDLTRRVAEQLCPDPRVLMHAQALPNVGPLEANLDAMEATVGRYPIAAWKAFTDYPQRWGRPGAWRFDDADPALPAVGQAFISKALELGKPIICVHKGLSGGGPYADPSDLGPAANANPEATFVAYHSGYEVGGREGEYRATGRPAGVDRLVRTVLDANLGTKSNVYAELGSTWWSLMGHPDQAAHVLGKLLLHLGDDNVLWGTDSIFYGPPQAQLQAFRAFEITPEYQERFGYPALTPERKAKILGLNAARLYGVKPVTTPCGFTRDDLVAVRKTLNVSFETFGPQTVWQRHVFVDAHHGMP